MTSANPDRVGKIRVLLVGNSGCGKTSLAHYLASLKPLKAPKLTVGCNVFVKLLEYQFQEASTGALTSRQCFVELWDVGAHERYKSMRGLFFSNMSGVLLVHDVSQPRSFAGLPKWADFVTQNATFSAPLADEQAAGNLGALPVPYLILGNKADLAGGSSLPQRLHWRGALARLLEGIWERFPLRNAWPALTRQLSRTASTMVPDADILEASISASALTGAMDFAAVDAFFTGCILRRYHAASMTQRPQEPRPRGRLAAGDAQGFSPVPKAVAQSPFSPDFRQSRPHSLPASGAVASWEVHGEKGQHGGQSLQFGAEGGRIDDDEA